MSELDFLSDDEHFRLHSEAMQIYYGQRLKCLEQALCQLATASGATVIGFSGFQEYYETLLRGELEATMKRLADVDPGKTSQIVRYLEDLHRKSREGRE